MTAPRLLAYICQALLLQLAVGIGVLDLVPSLDQGRVRRGVDGLMRWTRLVEMDDRHPAGGQQTQR